MSAALRHAAVPRCAACIAGLARQALVSELETHPKPGLVSHRDRGSHHDMDAALLRLSAATLEPFFKELAEAGRADAGMLELRRIGLRAEAAMLAATAGVNTHRGAIFGLGLLCAAAGYRASRGIALSLGAIVASSWGAAILEAPEIMGSHGAGVRARYPVAGARGEAAAGFPSAYGFGLPALRAARGIMPGNEEVARLQACMALIAQLDDTNLLHRGGAAGLAFAKAAAAGFLAGGGIARPDWQAQAEALHLAFVARNLSPGGSADLLAITLFIDGAEA